MVEAFRGHRKADSRLWEGRNQSTCGMQGEGVTESESRPIKGVSGPRSCALSHCSFPVCTPGLLEFPVTVVTHYHSETTLCDTILVAACLYTFVKSHRMGTTKTDPNVHGNLVASFGSRAHLMHWCALEQV